MKLEEAGLEVLGTAKKIKITKDSTTIVDGGGEAQAISERIERIKAQISESTSSYDAEKLQERAAKLSGGVAVIKVGAATETEMKDKKLRIEDALNATKAAVEEELFPAEVAFVEILKSMEDFKLQGEEGMGVEIVKKALMSPLKQIAVNAGLDGGVVAEKVKTLPDGFGLDAAKEEYVDMMANGIIDPAKVTRSAIQNAASIASLILTTEVVVAEKKEPAPMPSGNPNMMM